MSDNTVRLLWLVFFWVVMLLLQPFLPLDTKEMPERFYDQSLVDWLNGVATGIVFVRNGYWMRKTEES